MTQGLTQVCLQLLDCCLCRRELACVFVEQVSAVLLRLTTIHYNTAKAPSSAANYCRTFVTLSERIPSKLQRFCLPVMLAPPLSPLFCVDCIHAQIRQDRLPVILPQAMTALANLPALRANKPKYTTTSLQQQSWFFLLQPALNPRLCAEQPRCDETK